MQPLSLWLRWGVPQDSPTLTLTSGSSDLTPDFILNGDLAVNDTVRFQYSTDAGFSGASSITNTIDAAEDAANSLSFATGALTNGQTYYFRARVERPPRGITAWSNVETITFNLGGPISLFGKWFGGFGAPPLNNGGYISLFGRHFGGFGSTTARRGVGKPSGRRIQRAELDRRLKEQRDNTFGRRWFDEFQAAERAAREAALQAPKKAARKALDRAADAAAQVADELNATDAQVDLRPLTAALEALSGTKKLSETIAASKGAIEWANRIIAELKRAADEDEDEAMTLLMLQ